MQKEVEHPVLGKIVYIKRKNSKSVRLTVGNENEIRVTMPYFAPYSLAEMFVERSVKKIEALVKKVKAGKSAIEASNTTKSYTLKELEIISKRAHEILPQRLKYWSNELNRSVVIKNVLGISKKMPFSYNKVFIKNNKSNWGSCSSLRNINLNMHLVNLPQELMDFVIIHELCHLIHRNHGVQFHELVDNICNGNEASFQKQLRKYSYLLKGIK